MHLAVVGFFPEFCRVEFHSWKYNKKTGAGGWGLGAGGWGLGAGGWGRGAGGWGLGAGGWGLGAGGWGLGAGGWGLERLIVINFLCQAILRLHGFDLPRSSSRVPRTGLKT